MSLGKKNETQGTQSLFYLTCNPPSFGCSRRWPPKPRWLLCYQNPLRTTSVGAQEVRVWSDVAPVPGTTCVAVNSDTNVYVWCHLPPFTRFLKSPLFIVNFQFCPLKLILRGSGHQTNTTHQPFPGDCCPIRPDCPFLSNMDGVVGVSSPFSNIVIWYHININVSISILNINISVQYISIKMDTAVLSYCF